MSEPVLASINAQNDILNQQIENLNINIARIGKMLKDDAATQKQMDDLTGQVAVFFRNRLLQIIPRKYQLLLNYLFMNRKKQLLMNRLREVQCKKSVNGTIIEKYSEAGEITAAGKPLVKIADLSVMKLKVYVSGAQLGKYKNRTDMYSKN